MTHAAIVAVFQGLDRLCGFETMGIWREKTGNVECSGVMSMSVERQIRERLMVGLEPSRLDIVNESELHAGHRDAPGTGESHFRVLVVSAKFQGLNRVSRHRMVNEMVADLLKDRVHAFALRTFAPGEVIQ
jgi:BolA family transcriptional regulator, general stress-responsive regulator